MKRSKKTFSLTVILIAGILFLSKSLAMAQENVPPGIAITSPADSAWFAEPATITINTDVNDVDGTVTKVEFYNGITKIGEDSIPGPGTTTLVGKYSPHGGDSPYGVTGMAGNVW